MASVSVRGRRKPPKVKRSQPAKIARPPNPAPAQPQPVRFETPEDCVYRMPTLDEVRAAGYDGTDGRISPEDKLEHVRKRRDAMIARLAGDPELLRRQIAECQEEYDAMTEDERRAWRARERR